MHPNAPDPPVTSAPGPPPRFASGFGTATVALVTAGVLSLVVSAAEDACLGDRASYAAAITTACMATAILFAYVGPASWLHRSRTLRLASIALLGWAPYIFGGAASALSAPIIAGHFRCGTGDIALLFITALSLPVVLTTASVFASIATRSPFRRPVYVAGFVVTAVAVLAFGASLPRIGRPTADTYLASLPVVAELSGPQARFDGPAFSVEAHPSAPRAFGALSSCAVVATPRRTGDAGETIAPDCAGVKVLHDARSHLWLIVGTDRTITFGEGASPNSGGIDTELEPRRVAASLRPPTAWILLSAAGCLVAIFALLRARRELARARAWHAARPGVHAGGGWVSFADGSATMHIAAAAPCPHGDILVSETGAPAIPHYREHGQPRAGGPVLPGTIAQLTAEACDHATALSAFALLASTLSMAPMAAAFFRGILG